MKYFLVERICKTTPWCRKHHKVFLLLKKGDSAVSQAPRSFDSPVSQAPRSFDLVVSQAPLSHLQRLITQPKNKKIKMALGHLYWD